MSKLQRILILFLTVYLGSTGYLADASKGKIDDILEEHLSAYDISFLIKADLNNDGKEEKVALYRQWDGEDPRWSDDQWHIICIFDEADNLLYKKDISYFQEVGSLTVKDTDGDSLKEIVILLKGAHCWDAKTQVYEWEKDSYRFMGEFRG